uniref:ShKT domain-containing protein n=2 Tax=Meloidogyne incognita group TaxID=654580 RepID=A0A914MQK8_MELIC
MLDIGAGSEGTCDGSAIYVEGRCCLSDTTTTTTPSTTTTPTNIQSYNSIKTYPTKICLYRNDIFQMYCQDKHSMQFCQSNLGKCTTNNILQKYIMAYGCCYSCYLAFPKYLPEHKGNKGRPDCGGGNEETNSNCVDKDEKGCKYWAAETTTKWCRNSGVSLKYKIIFRKLKSNVLVPDI